MNKRLPIKDLGLMGGRYYSKASFRIGFVDLQAPDPENIIYDCSVKNKRHLRNVRLDYYRRNK